MDNNEQKTMPVKESAPYAIGYGKPPPTKWKKGVSGNPKGPTPRLLNLADLIRKRLAEKDGNTESNRTKLDSILSAAETLALSGDKDARRDLLSWGWGKPMQSVDLTTLGEKFATGPQKTIDVTKLNEEQIDALFNAVNAGRS